VKGFLMDKHKNYHMYGILAIVILILLIIFFSLYAGRRNTNGSSGRHSHTASSPASTPGTDIIKDTGDDYEVSLYLKEQDSIISDMMENMSIKNPGSAELGFLTGMIPHHEAGIGLTKSYLKYGGKNKRLKNLASEIIEEQQEELNEMRELLNEIKKTDITGTESERGYLNSYNKIISSHQHIEDETRTASDVEKAYIEGMVIHHQMAVDMANVILEYSRHKDIIDIAEDIIEMQKEEISQMEEIFKDM